MPVTAPENRVETGLEVTVDATAGLEAMGGEVRVVAKREDAVETVAARKAADAVTSGHVEMIGRGATTDHEGANGRHEVAALTLHCKRRGPADRNLRRRFQGQVPLMTTSKMILMTSSWMTNL